MTAGQGAIGRGRPRGPVNLNLPLCLSYSCFFARPEEEQLVPENPSNISLNYAVDTMSDITKEALFFIFPVTITAKITAVSVLNYTYT